MSTAAAPAGAGSRPPQTQTQTQTNPESQLDEYRKALHMHHANVQAISNIERNCRAFASEVIGDFHIKVTSKFTSNIPTGYKHPAGTDAEYLARIQTALDTVKVYETDLSGSGSGSGSGSESNPNIGLGPFEDHVHRRFRRAVAHMDALMVDLKIRVQEHSLSGFLKELM